MSNIYPYDLWAEDWGKMGSPTTSKKIGWCTAYGAKGPRALACDKVYTPAMVSKKTCTVWARTPLPRVGGA